MASSEDSEPKVKGTFGVRRLPGDPVRKQLDYLQKVRMHFGRGLSEYYTDDRVYIEFVKQYPPPYMAPSDKSANQRIIAINELSLEICEILNHLHISPTANHVQQAFDKNQIDTLRYIMRGMMTHYTTNNT